MHDHLDMTMDACDPRSSSDYTGMRGSGVNELLHQKELELHKLRETSIRDLEEKLAKKEEDAQQALKQLYKLQEDFKYNLSLLDKRDAELHDLDEHMAVLAAELGRKDALLVDLHQALQLAQSELVSDRAYFQSTMASHSRELSNIEKALGEANNKELAAVEARVQFEGREKQLQEEIICARLAHEQEMHACQMQFEARAERMKVQHTEEIEKLRVDISALSQLAEDRGLRLKDSQLAQSSERQLAMEHELELQKAKEALASSQAELNDCRLLNAQLRLQLEEAQKQASEDRLKLGALHAAEVQQCRETIENQKVQLLEQEQLKRQSNDMSQKFFQLQSEMVGLQDQMKSILSRKDSQEDLNQEEHQWAKNRLCALEKELRDQERTHDMELRAAVEELWAKEQELRDQAVHMQIAFKAQYEAEAAQLAAEEKVAKVETSAQEHRQQIARLKRERAKLSQDVRSLKSQLKVRLADKRRKLTSVTPKTCSLDSLASSPLVSISTLSEPASNSPSKWVHPERCSLSPVETIRNCVNGDATLASPSDTRQVLVRGDTVRHTGDKAPGDKESKIQSGQSVPEAAQQAQSVGLEMVTIASAGLKSNSRETPYETVHALAVELAAARSRAAMLAEENERLMELSSQLRFEWERAFTTKLQKQRAPLQLISQEFSPSPECHWQAAMDCLPSYLQKPAPCLPCQPQAPRRVCHVCCHVGLQWQDRADECKENNNGTEIHEVNENKEAEARNLPEFEAGQAAATIDCKETERAENIPERLPVSHPSENQNTKQVGGLRPQNRVKIQAKGKKPKSLSGLPNDGVTGQRLSIRNWNVKEP
eukprot:jgi/Botrbrau1/17200/Bobra.126_1s0005.2